jgi:hypothetical protein
MVIFISYSSKNRDLVDQLADHLTEMGYTVLYDQKILAGKAWWDKILEDIRDCTVFIYALSPECVDSYPCDLEYRYARELNRPMLPVMILPVDFKQVPSHIALTNVLNYTNLDSREPLMKLVRTLNELNRQSSPVLPTPLPVSPPAPIFPLNTVIDKITDFSVSLTKGEQEVLLAEIRNFLYKRATQHNARYALERFRKRSDFDLTANIADEIDSLLELSVGDATPPPLVERERLTAAEAQAGPKTVFTLLQLIPRSIIGTVALLLALGGGGLIIRQLGQLQGSATPTTIAQKDTATITPSQNPLTHTLTPTLSSPAGILTKTAVPTTVVSSATFARTPIPPTATPTPTLIPPSQTRTMTAIPTRPTDTPSKTYTPSLDAVAAAQATNIAEITIDAARTLLFIQGQTATAKSWTATYTPSPTVPSLTPSLTSTSTPIVAGMILFKEDFEPGKPLKFLSVKGPWGVKDDNGNKVYEVNATSCVNTYCASVVFGATTWTDYAIDYRVKMLNGRATSDMVFRSENGVGGYIAQFGPRNSGMTLAISPNGQPWQALKWRSYTIRQKVWYQIRIEVKGNKIRISVNGDKPFEVTNSEIRSGGLSLSVSDGSHVQWDDICVTAL